MGFLENQKRKQNDSGGDISETSEHSVEVQESDTDYVHRLEQTLAENDEKIRTYDRLKLQFDKVQAELKEARLEINRLKIQVARANKQAQRNKIGRR